jgi:hypothetical protein
MLLEAPEAAIAQLIEATRESGQGKIVWRDPNQS